MAKVASIGAGSWGTAVAGLAALNGNEVVLWCRRPELAVLVLDLDQPGRARARMEAALVLEPRRAAWRKDLVVWLIARGALREAHDQAVIGLYLTPDQADARHLHEGPRVAPYPIPFSGRAEKVRHREQRPRRAAGTETGSHRRS